MKIRIGGYTDISTVDYPGEVVSVIFLCGCPFKCPFCQNAALVRGENCNDTEIKEISSLLEKYSDFTTGTCITGGEPCLQARALISLLSELKEFGKRKIDTNGFYPEVMEEILEKKLIDYVAIDVKTVLEPEKYGRVIGVPEKGKIAIERLKRTLELVIQQRPQVYLEARTTIVPNLVDKKEDIELIAKNLDVDCFTLQQFRSNMGTLDPSYENLLSPPRSQLIELARIAKKHVQCVKIRTLENGEEIID
ncbi:MAG: anaerobic ribonucleoside-triphosphate reductase activating protein [Candidatus Helarchaeales archaeon]